MSEFDSCPLCCEELDATDKGFQPCQCGYKICLYCFSRIVDSTNPKCPACRAEYSKDKLKAQPDASVIRASKEELQRKKKEKQEQKLAKESSKPKNTAGSDKRPSERTERNKKVQRDVERLANVRVKQPNLVYVMGLPPNATKAKVESLFGQYGHITKTVRSPNPRGHGHSSHRNNWAYITYETPSQAGAAIRALHGRQLENGRPLSCIIGTTKYCTYFLRQQECKNPTCLYLHQIMPESSSMGRDETKVLKQSTTIQAPSMRRYQSQPTPRQPVMMQRRLPPPPPPPKKLELIENMRSAPLGSNSWRSGERSISSPNIVSRSSRVRDSRSSNVSPSAPPGLGLTKLGLQKPAAGASGSYQSLSPVAATSLPPGLSHPPPSIFPVRGSSRGSVFDEPISTLPTPPPIKPPIRLGSAPQLHNDAKSLNSSPVSSTMSMSLSANVGMRKDFSTMSTTQEKDVFPFARPRDLGADWAGGNNYSPPENVLNTSNSTQATRGSNALDQFFEQLTSKTASSGSMLPTSSSQQQQKDLAKSDFPALNFDMFFQQNRTESRFAFART